MWPLGDSDIGYHIQGRIQGVELLLYSLIRAAPCLAYFNRKRGLAIKRQSTMASGVFFPSWTKSLSDVPPLTQSVVDEWANGTAKIPRAKQQKGYSNFIEGYVHNVEGKCVLHQISPIWLPLNICRRNFVEVISSLSVL